LLGVCEARTVGAKEAKGEYLIFLDGDDMLHRDCLAEMYDVIEKGQYDMIGCLVETFGKENKKESGKRDAGFHSILWLGNVYPTFLFKRKDFFKIGGYDEAFKAGMEDFDFFVRMMESVGKPFIIKKHLVFYRKHGDSRLDKFRTQKKEKQRFKLRLKVISNSPRMYYDYICLLRKKNIKKKRLINKLLILVGFLIIIMFGFQL